ncbi:MAG: chemotaxis protein CheW [Firmicutes bacterium]|jgi:purine-binding chemotaxis protein CheW|nr:chemotaxis protein CheW [Bacillota bacterium]
MSANTDTELSQKSESIQVVVFQMGKELFAVSISDVWEIVLMQPITPVPGAPDFVEGVVNLRGQIIPVINLAKRLGLESREETSETRIVVTQVGDETVGMIVDAVQKVTHIPIDDIEVPNGIALDGEVLAYVQGIAKVDKGLISLIDLEEAISL